MLAIRDNILKSACDVVFSACANGAVSVNGGGVTAVEFTEIACVLGPIGTEGGDVCVEMCAWGCASAAAMGSGDSGRMRTGVG